MTLKKVTLILIPFLLAAVIIGYTPKSTETAAYNVKKENFNIDGYLEENHAEINLKSASGFSLLDEGMKKSDVILAGKSGGLDENYQLKLSLLKYLNKKQDVRYLLEELGYSESSLINEYLKSGNEEYLKQVYENKSGPVIYTDQENAYHNKKSYIFWNELRKYNHTLPEGKKITVIGIGAENRVGTALKYLNSLLPKNEPDEEIKPFIKDLKNISSQKCLDGIINVIKKLECSMESDPDEYRKYLGRRYFDFNLIADNILNADKIYNASGTDMKKETELCMFNNFQTVYSPDGKYFGEFDMEHLYSKEVTGFSALLSSSDSTVKGRVLSIGYASESNKSLVSAENLQVLKRSSKSDLTLFKLDGDNSPFNAKSYFFPDIDGRSDKDHFKYLILIKS
ncbi:MAG: hypothetical protein LIR50_21965 [Bacillota bacterium]|nr:hypothetical protein [Bacillota bacterium]